MTMSCRFLLPIDNQELQQDLDKNPDIILDNDLRMEENLL